MLTVKIKKVTTPPHINKKTRLSRSSRKKNCKNFVAKINEFQKLQKKITSPNHSKLPQKNGPRWFSRFYVCWIPTTKWTRHIWIKISHLHIIIWWQWLDQASFIFFMKISLSWNSPRNCPTVSATCSSIRPLSWLYTYIETRKTVQ